jgi:hypothetical protein
MNGLIIYLFFKFLENNYETLDRNYLIDEKIYDIKTKIKREFCDFNRRDRILIDKNDLLLEKCIGRGNFGCVFKGFLNTAENLVEEVAVKRLENCKFIKNIGLVLI